MFMCDGFCWILSFLGLLLHPRFKDFASSCIALKLFDLKVIICFLCISQLCSSCGHAGRPGIRSEVCLHIHICQSVCNGRRLCSEDRANVTQSDCESISIAASYLRGCSYGGKLLLRLSPSLTVCVFVFCHNSHVLWFVQEQWQLSVSSLMHIRLISRL